MASIDERIVSMAFENAKFEAALGETMRSLQKLSDSLAKVGKVTGFGDIDKAASKVSLTGPMSALDKLKSRLFGSGQGAAEGMSQIEAAGNKVQLEQPIRALDKVKSETAQVGNNAANGFAEIERAAGKISLQGLTTALENVSSKFSVLQGAASVAFGNIAAQASMRGASFAKSFALGPIQQGLQEYQTNLSSIQTILANTSDSGGNLKTVNAALQELNHYSDQTIYNFSEMAKNIGTFTAAGVQLKPATQAIKGIANLAALSGSNSQQASTAMYQLSQAIAAGRVGLQDWNSVVNAGMGGAVFQKALMRTAENMGALKDGAVKIDKATGKATVNGQSFRESIMAKPGEKSWLSSDVLTKTLSQFTGDMSNAQLAAQGFDKAQIAAIQRQAKMAQNAATQVKTLPQVFDVARETIGSGWSATFQNIFGDFGESKKLFTSLSNSINGFINVNSKARNKVLKDWKALGGRTELIDGLKQAFKDLSQILKPISQAFRDIFPRKTGADLFEMTKNFTSFMRKLEPSKTTIENLRKIFRGLFAVLDIGKTIFGEVVGVILKLVGAAGKGSGGILAFGGSIGDFVTSLDKAISKGHALSGFFNGLAAILRVPIDLLRSLASSFFGLFGDKNTKKVNGAKESFDHLGKSLGVLEGPLKTIGNLVKKVTGFFGHLGDLVGPILGTLGHQFAAVISELGDAIANADYDRISSVIQTGLLGAIFFSLKKGISSGIGGIHLKAFTADLRGLNQVFGGLTGNLKAMQKSIQAATLLEIGAAVGVLAAGVFTLSKIDPKRLASAMTAVAVGLGELVGAMHLMTTGLGLTGFAKLPFIAASIVILAAAVDVLAIAVKIFSKMDWEELGKGLVGLGGSLTALGLGLQFIGPRVAFAPLILITAVALNILAAAVKQFGAMDLEEIGRGLLGIGGALAAMGLGLEFIGPQALLAGPAIVVASIGLSMLSGAVASFAELDMKKLGQGLIGVATSLLVVGGAMEAIPPTIALQAAGLILVSIALHGLASAVKILGQMNGAELSKGIIAMGAALVVLAGGMMAMQEGSGGSVALLAAAAALAVLAPTLGFLGTLKWSTILRGLGAIAATLGVLGIMGAIASEPISALGFALLPLAGAMAIGAAATWLFAKALVALGSGGAKGIAVMIAAATAAITLIPKLIVNFFKGILGTLAYAAEIAPKVAESLAKIIDVMIAMVIREAPKLALAWGTLIDSVIYVITVNTPKLINAGLQLLVAFLSGLAQNIPKVTENVALIVAGFLNALAAKAPELTAAGANFIVAFLNGISSKFEGIAAAAVRAVTRWIAAVAGQGGQIAEAGIRIIGKFIGGIASHVGSMFQTGANAVMKLLAGISSKVGAVVGKAVEIAGKFIHHMATGLVRLTDVGAKALIDFLNGLADVVRKRSPEMRAAGLNLADAIIDGLTLGIKDKIKHPIKTVKDGAKGIVKGFKDTIKSRSPSLVFHEIGTNIMEGLGNGISAGTSGAAKSMAGAGDHLVATAQKSMSNVPNLLDGITDMDPTITPVLDLSKVKKDAGQITDITKTKPISAILSIGHAGSLVQEKAAADQAKAESAAAAAIPSVKFEQHNISPEPLSTAEIYRRTNNQVSKIRKEVGIPDRRKPR